MCSLSALRPQTRELLKQLEAGAQWGNKLFSKPLPLRALPDPSGQGSPSSLSLESKAAEPDTWTLQMDEALYASSCCSLLALTLLAVPLCGCSSASPFCSFYANVLTLLCEPAATISPDRCVNVLRVALLQVVAAKAGIAPVGFEVSVLRAVSHAVGSPCCNPNRATPISSHSHPCLMLLLC